MPFKVPDEQKRFKWTLAGDLPVGECVRWGNALYCLCCPLCGMLHEIQGVGHESSGGEYQPVCIVKQTHKTTYAAWVGKHPESIEFSRIWLKMRGGDVIPLDTSQPSVKRNRKAVA